MPRATTGASREGGYTEGMSSSQVRPGSTSAPCRLRCGRWARRLAALRFPRLEPDRRRRHRRWDNKVGHLATRRWYYLVPATGEPRGLVHKIEKHSLAHLPGSTHPVRRPRSVGSWAAHVADRHDAGSRWNIRRAARFLMSRGSTPERSSSSASAARGRLVRRSHSALLRRVGRRGDRHASPGVRQAVSREGPRVRRRRPAAARSAPPTTEYDIQQQMGGWFRDEGLISDADPNVSGGRELRQPALFAHRVRASRHSRGRDSAARSLGQAGSSGRCLCRYHVGWLLGPGPRRFARRLRRDLRRARCRHRARAATPRARVANCAASKSIARPPPCCATPVMAITFCIGPATVWAKPCTATA